MEQLPNHQWVIQEKQLQNILTEIFLKGDLQKVQDKVLENIHMLIKMYMMVTEEITQNTEQENQQQMLQQMKKLEKKVEVENIMDILKMAINMVKVYILIQIKIFIVGFGNLEKSMDKELILNDTGVKLIGSWNEGQLLSGKWLLPNGTYYEGNFKYNKPDGTGKWVFKNGNIVQGDYKQSVIPAADPTDPSKIMDIKLEWITNFNAQ